MYLSPLMAFEFYIQNYNIIAIDFVNLQKKRRIYAYYDIRDRVFL